MTGAGSAVVRRQLGIKLRNMRIRAGKSVADVAEARLGSKAKMSRLETGKGTIRVADVIALCRFYGADEVTTAALVAMAPGTQQADWWEASPGVIPDWLGLYAGLEAAASEIRCFEPQYVHGLLQTEDYARAVIGVDPRLPLDLVERRVRFRLERQQRSLESVTVIMGEGALSMVAGSDEVMAAQIDHLRSSAADVRILPFRAGLTPRRSAWTMFTFEDDDDPNVVYEPGAGGNRYLDKPQDWADYEFIWSILMERAVPIGEWST